MEDRELLELAAKACGLEVSFSEDGICEQRGLNMTRTDAQRRGKRRAQPVRLNDSWANYGDDADEAA